MFVRKYRFYLKKRITIYSDYHFLCPVVSHQNKTSAISKLDGIRKTIEERTKNFKNLIDNHRRILANNIDNHIQNLEQT